jgi:hypothetical protein
LQAGLNQAAPGFIRKICQIDPDLFGKLDQSVDIMSVEPFESCPNANLDIILDFGLRHRIWGRCNQARRRDNWGNIAVVELRDV